MTDIKTGRYRHYKGQVYEVTGFARHSETLENMVIYRQLYGDGSSWVRPAIMFSELVNVNGQTVLRFEKISDV